MALLIIKGLRYAPLVMAAELLSGATLPIAPISAVPVCLGSLVVTAGYTGAAAVLRHAGLQAGIRRSSDVVKLIIVTIISSGLVAGGFVASYAAEGVVPFSGFVEAGFHFWIGDAIGIVVVVPPLLLLYERITQWTPPDYDRPHFDSSSSPHRARALSRRSQACSRESVGITLSGFFTCCSCRSSGSRRVMVYPLRAGRFWRSR